MIEYDPDRADKSAAAKNHTFCERQGRCILGCLPAARHTLDRHNLAEAFGHSTGHGLGVEIHEAPRVGPRREAAAEGGAPADDLIEPGMVFTIEPGAYIPGWGGVRIEDDVLVTGEGVELLTNVPREL